MENKDKPVEKTLAEKLHELNNVNFEIEETIDDAFEKYEPEIFKVLDYSIGSDYYDNSIEIYIKNILPYPYEPCWDVREAVYGLGFGIVYWNFADQDGRFTEEIRGNEPRRFKNYQPKDNGSHISFGHIHIPTIGYVDNRFNKEEWEKNYKQPFKYSSHE